MYARVIWQLSVVWQAGAKLDVPIDLGLVGIHHVPMGIPRAWSRITAAHIDAPDAAVAVLWLPQIAVMPTGLRVDGIESMTDEHPTKGVWLLRVYSG